MFSREPQFIKLRVTMTEKRLVDEMPPMFAVEEEIAQKRANAHLVAGVGSGFSVVKIIDHFRPRSLISGFMLTYILHLLFLLLIFTLLSKFCI
jgi:hypothetical protein